MMNLKTHTAYAEIDIKPTHVFTVKIIDSKGKVKFEDMGAGKDNDDARKRANNMVKSQELTYRKGEH